MSELKHISSYNKERLVQLVNKTANLVNDGLNPTDALVKAAAAGDYPAEYVMRAAEAYNGAAHLSYFKSADTESRGNSFLLADGAAALAQVVNSADVSNKKAADVGFSYLSEPGSYFEPAVLADLPSFYVKQASTKIDFLSLQKSAAALDKQDLLAVETNRSVYNEACNSLARSVSVFRDKTAGVSSHRRSHWAREMLERHGKSALDVISLATGITGLDCEKLAVDKIGFFSLGNAELDSLDSIIRGYNQVSMLSGKLAQTEHDGYINKLERNSLLNVAAGVKRSASIPTADDVLDTLVPGADASSDSIQRGALDSLVDPTFVDDSTRIDKALMVHKLRKSDPIIAGHPVEDLEQALSEIYSIAPTAASTEPLLRSMLRRRLEAGMQIDDFSLNQMLGMENSMRTQRKDYTIVPKLTGIDSDKAKEIK